MNDATMEAITSCDPMPGSTTEASWAGDELEGIDPAGIVADNNDDKPSIKTGKQKRRRAKRRANEKVKAKMQKYLIQMVDGCD